MPPRAVAFLAGRKRLCNLLVKLLLVLQLGLGVLRPPAPSVEAAAGGFEHPAHAAYPEDA